MKIKILIKEKLLVAVNCFKILFCKKYFKIEM